MPRVKGLSLTEVLIVVLAIVIMAGIAVPRLLHSEIAGNESSAIGTVLAVNRAEAAYASQQPDRGFTCDLKRLASAQPQLMDKAMAQGVKSGYKLALSGCAGHPARSYFIAANPLPRRGTRRFCSDQSGVIRYDPGTGDCTTASPPLK